MFTIWLIFHVIVSVALILVVLMQSSKGEGLAGTAFSGGGGLSGAVFGGRGAASFLSKATTILAILFMVNSAALAFMSAGGRHQAPGSTPSNDVESVVTQKAQAEREKALQQQSQQQQQPQTQPGDSTINLQVLPNQATDTSGKK